MKNVILFAIMLLMALATNGQECMDKIKVDTCKDTIISKEEYSKLLSVSKNMTAVTFSNNSLSNDNAALKARLKKLEVDEFLNIEDPTIFGSKFLRIDESKIPARSRDFYKLIRYIHDLNDVLNQRGEGSVTELLLKAKENAEKASSIIDIITTVDKDVFSWLSKSQTEYYRELINKYNELIESLNH